MKKKLVALLLCGALATCMITACGQPGEDKKTESTDANKEEKKEEKKDDGIIDFGGDSYHIKYVKHEFGKDYEGNNVLLYYYTFENKGDENTTAGFAANVQCFQDGSECETAITEERNESMDNYAINEVQPGGTVEVCQAYKLKSNSEITIEVSDLISFDGAKDTQKIAVQ